MKPERKSPDIAGLLREELVRTLAENPRVADPETLADQLIELADQQSMRWVAHLADRVSDLRRRS